MEGTYSNELVALHEINEWNVHHFLFDGVICFEGRKRYLQGIPFNLLSIGGYEELETTSVRNNLWLQSFEARPRDVWYRLCSPSPEYRRYQTTFMWIADLAKHVVDFLYTHDRVCLQNFKKDFYRWLKGLYTQNLEVGAWMEEYGHSDFRNIITTYANFLHCQAIQVDHSYKNHPLWAEIHPRELNAIPPQSEKLKAPQRFTSSKEGQTVVERRKTTVTPLVYKCFQHLPWAKFLYAQPPSDPKRYREMVTLMQTGVLYGSSLSKVRYTSRWHPSGGSEIQISIGDVVAVPSDAAGTWKNQGSKWYGLIQGIENTINCIKLGLIWLYRPTDTVCMNLHYPHTNELFLSDHCNCGDPAIYADEVLFKPRVAFYGQQGLEDADFFCRQHYIESDSAWVTLEPSHFRCTCRSPKVKTNYIPGETILFTKRGFRGKNWLEPAVVVGVIPQTDTVRIRRLLRMKRDFHDLTAARNELVYTDLIEDIRSKQINRRCNIRFYTIRERDTHKIPIPYDRQGMVDCYYICTRQISDNTSEPLRRPWPSNMREGWNPLEIQSHRVLRGLDIFCGGGNFGRGLEEGGAVKFEYAVDYFNEAIHTYRANLRETHRTKLFRGSVNQYLSEALEGNRHDGLVAQHDDIEFIAAGSPCQGFSLANPFKGTDSGLFNESMVASVVSFIDFYRPKYAVLENVKGMASGGEDQSPLAAVTCALVGMGYQVRTLALDAWSFGSPQSRSRIFISVSAPGLAPLLEPPQTHAHPEDIVGGSLGRTANGLRTSARYVVPTPFEYNSAIDATKDLPPTDALLTCIAHPDHRISRPMSVLNRNLVSSVPRFPGGHGFLSAYKLGLMPKAQIENYTWDNQMRAGKASKSFSRIRRDRLIPTILTVPKPEDGVTGTLLHWDDHRMLTILEVRRAQGFLDREVIVGSTASQWKIVGNSVARPVALALGISLRNACTAEELHKDSRHASASAGSTHNDGKGKAASKRVEETVHDKDNIYQQFQPIRDVSSDSRSESTQTSVSLVDH